MAKIISIFNNKGGVGKTVITWNLGDALARAGKRTLLIDFDPQCNLSIAILGEEKFRTVLPTESTPYGKSIRSYLQRFLQNTGGEEVFLHHGNKHHSDNLSLVAGDFWLNVYAESLNVGADLLTGTGIAKFVVLKKLVAAAEKKAGSKFDFVLIDLPPSFGGLVRAALYSSDYLIVPCTSDNFSAYCVGLIGQMLPSFLADWRAGLKRFSESNPAFKDYNKLGKPKFAGWIFNGYDTAKKRFSTSGEKVMMLADKAHHGRLSEAIQEDLVAILKSKATETGYDAVSPNSPVDYQLGGVEDMNVLIQNSLWQSIPVSQLNKVKQVGQLGDRASWAANQADQIKRLRKTFKELGNCVITTCL